MFVALALLIDTGLSYRSNTTSTLSQLAMLKVFNIISRSKSVKSENGVSIVVFVLRLLLLKVAIIYSIVFFAENCQDLPGNKAQKIAREQEWHGDLLIWILQPP